MTNKMLKPEINLGRFHTSSNELSDGSTTTDVYYSTPYWKELVAEPPNARCAEALADALNIVRERILECGSDKEVFELMNKLYRWKN